MEIQICPMAEVHLSQVLEIEKSSFPVPFSENLFQMELRLSVAHMYVGGGGERVVGYFDFWHIGPEIHLINIAVHPDCRHQGVGGQFIRFMIDYAKGHEVKEIYLDVRESNAVAIHLYERFGFKAVAVRDAYYEDNKENAFVMELRL